MLPPLKHRLVIGLVVVVGALCWLLARGPLQPADDSGGLSLMDARVGLGPALLIVITAGMPAFIAGLLAASTGNPLTGAFTVSGALVPLAALGGSIEGYLRRAPMPGGYKPLAVEAGIWLALLLVVFIVIDLLRKLVRPKLDKLAVRRHLGVRTQMTQPDVKALLAGLVTAGAGAFLSMMIIKTPDGGQVNGGLMLGFGVAAMIAQMSVPQRNPIAILISPLVVAVVVYLWVASSFKTSDDLLATWYNGHLLSLAYALPIHYASSGVVGCAMGVGLAQTIDHVRQTTTVTA